MKAIRAMMFLLALALLSIVQPGESVANRTILGPLSAGIPVAERTYNFRDNYCRLVTPASMS
jgi:hypothetical protein